jgi:hypothetical protein
MRSWEPINPLSGELTCVLGARLVPVTIGHLRLIDDAGIDMFNLGIDDIPVCVFICSRTAIEARKDLMSKWCHLAFRLWGWRTRRLDKTEEIRRFLSWFQEQQRGPITKSPAGIQSDSDDHAAPMHVNLLALATARLHISNQEALGMTVRDIKQRLVALGESEGTVKPWTHKDERLLDLGRAFSEQSEKEQDGAT